MLDKTDVRGYTNHLLDLIDEGVLDPVNVVTACVKYMSEDEVADMCRMNEFVWDEEDDEE